MNLVYPRIVCAAFGLLVLSQTGCGRRDEAPPEMTTQQLVDDVHSKFAKSDAKAKAAAAGLETALKSGQLPMAFAEARTLAANPDLTPEERAAAAQAIVTTVKELKKAAEAGDKEAAEVVRAYTSSR